MRSYLTGIMAFFILLLAVDNVAIAHDDGLPGYDQQVSSIPVVDVDPLTYRTRITPDAKLNYIADSFIPMVILAFNLFEERDFTYYLPLYNLHRQKEYFLLI